MGKKEIKGMIRTIYELINKLGITSHKYYDDSYSGVIDLKNFATRAAQCYSYNYRPVVIIDHIKEDQYCKEYHCTIEDSETGERYGGGCIVASFCGTIENPRSAYDLCATWWAE